MLIYHLELSETHKSAKIMLYRIFDIHAEYESPYALYINDDLLSLHTIKELISLGCTRFFITNTVHR